jgi:hypothetical protein
MFCGRPADSYEHIFSDWLRNVLPSDQKTYHYRRAIGPGSTELQEWERRPFREKTRFVCGKCNGGWMSRLESAVKPILVPAITREGLPYVLDERGQYLAATWALKTGFILDVTQSKEPLAPRFLIDSLYARMRPPHQVTIWIGAHYRAREDPVNSVYVPRPLGLEPSEETPDAPSGSGHAYFLAVAGVCFLIIGHHYGNRVVFTCGEPWKDALIKIWPIEARQISFPPEFMMDRDFIDLLFQPDTIPKPLEARIAY